MAPQAEGRGLRVDLRQLPLFALGGSKQLDGPVEMEQPDARAELDGQSVPLFGPSWLWLLAFLRV